MALPVQDTMIAPVMATLLECYTTEIERVPDPPELKGLRPGQQIELLLSTLDDECCRGLAWVRLANFYPSRNFPNPDVDYTSCSPTQWAIVLELGAARCAPTPSAEAMASPQEWDEVTIAVLDDAAAIRRALCCFTALDVDRMYKFDLWQPLATEGGCTGGTMQITVAALACDCVEVAS